MNGIESSALAKVVREHMAMAPERLTAYNKNGDRMLGRAEAAADIARVMCAAGNLSRAFLVACGLEVGTRKHLEWEAEVSTEHPGKYQLFRFSHPDDIESGTEIKRRKTRSILIEGRILTYDNLIKAKAAASKYNRNFDFKRCMWDALIFIGCKPCGSPWDRRDLELETKAGRLLLSVWSTGDVVTRFDDVKRAKELLGDGSLSARLNGFSGKWNHHYEPVPEAIECIVSDIRAILP